MTITELTLLIMGIVEFIKKLDVQGRALILVAFACGLTLTVAHQLGELYPQAQMWIDLAFRGLAGGLAACGLYDLINKRFPKMP